MRTLTSSEAPDAMPENGSLQQDLQKQSLGAEVHLKLENLTCDQLIPCMYIMNYPRPIVSNQREEDISIQREVLGLV